MAISVLVSTTGAGTVTFPDLGLKSLTHPIVDEEFIGQYTASELAESVDFQTALTNTDITVKLDGALITDARLIAEGIQDAAEVPYDNGTSGLTATDVKAALDEIAADVGTDPTLAEVLTQGNATGGTSVIVTHGDAILGEDDGNGTSGGNVLVAAGDATVGNNVGGNLTISAGAGVGTGVDGDLIIGASDTATVAIGDGSNDVTIHSLVYPTADGADGDHLVTDGSGNLTFETPVAPVNAATFSLGAARKANNVSNTYLYMYNDLATNESGYVLPYDCTLIALTAATDGAETWSGEIHIANTLVTGALVSITAAASGVATVDVDFSAGDIIQFYCNGTAVAKPNLQAFFERR
jgi:hypothetical protein